MKSINSLIIVIALATTCLTGLVEGADSFDLQAALKAAQPGAVIEVPAGIYSGAINIGPDVTLVGEGLGLTIIDGVGADVVVSADKYAAIMGCTIKNGRIGIQSKGNFIGVFECEIRDYTYNGIRLHEGSGVVAHNRIRGSKRQHGIMSINANPLISGNLIRDNNFGVSIHLNMMPTLENNTFVGNNVGIYVRSSIALASSGNVFDRNGTNIKGAELSESDFDEAVDIRNLELYSGGSVAAYRALMKAVETAAISQHPRVIYDLNHPLGLFGVTILYPWATFVIGASTVDTIISEFDAYDDVTSDALAAEYKKLSNDRPAVSVNNPDIVDKEHDRYVLDKLYKHPGSYFINDMGQTVFRRLTTMSRIEVVLPPGKRAVAISHEATVDEIDDQQIINITDIGSTVVEITME